MLLARFGSILILCLCGSHSLTISDESSGLVPDEDLDLCPALWNLYIHAKADQS